MSQLATMQAISVMSFFFGLHPSEAGSRLGLKGRMSAECRVMEPSMRILPAITIALCKIESMQIGAQKRFLKFMKFVLKHRCADVPRQVRQEIHIVHGGENGSEHFLGAEQVRDVAP